MKPWTHLPQILMGECGKFENSELNLLTLTEKKSLFTSNFIYIYTSKFSSFIHFLNSQIGKYHAIYIMLTPGPLPCVLP